MVGPDQEPYRRVPPKAHSILLHASSFRSRSAKPDSRTGFVPGSRLAAGDLLIEAQKPDRFWSTPVTSLGIARLRGGSMWLVGWAVGVADGIPGCVEARTSIEWDSNVRSRLSIVYAADAQALCRRGRASVGFFPRSVGGRFGYLAGGYEGEAPQRYADQVPKPDLL